MINKLATLWLLFQTMSLVMGLIILFIGNGYEKTN